MIIGRGSANVRKRHRNINLADPLRVEVLEDRCLLAISSSSWLDTSNREVFEATSPLPVIESVSDGVDLSIELQRGSPNAIESFEQTYSVSVSNDGTVSIVDAHVFVTFPKTYSNFHVTAITPFDGATTGAVTGLISESFATAVSLPVGSTLVFVFSMSVGDRSTVERASSTIDQTVARVDVPTTYDADVNPNNNRRTDSVSSFVSSSGGTLQFAAEEASAPQFLGDDFAFGDVNGDGERDLVVVDSISGTRVFVRDGDDLNLAITFADSSRRVRLADVNNDGHLDIVSAIGNTLTVRRNLGDGTFEGATTTNVSTGITDIFVADFTNDGWLDVITLSENSLNRLFVNQGGDRFSNSGGAGANGRDLGIGDLDGDGDADIAVVSPLGVQPYLNRNGTFSAFGPRITGTEFYSVAVGDVDADGDLDLIAAGGVSTRVFANNGRASFQEGEIPAISESGEFVRLADFDGDGDLDVAFARSDREQFLAVWMNDGHGIYSEGEPFVVPHRSATRIYVEDLDGDSDLDLLFTGGGGGYNQVAYNGNMDVTVQYSADVSAASPGAVIPVQLTVANSLGDTEVESASLRLDLLGIAGSLQLLGVDASGGAHTDAIPGGLSSGWSDPIYLPVGAELRYSMQLTIPSEIPPNSTHELFVELAAEVHFDLEADDGSPQSNHDSLFFTVTRTSVMNSGLFIRGDLIGDDVRRVDTGDIDGDGDLDLFLSHNGRSVTLWRNDDGQFLQTEPGPGVLFADNIALGDLDRDGDLDVVTASRTHATILLNDGSGLFVFQSTIETSNGVAEVVIGDLDGDGFADIFLEDGERNAWFNDGQGNFAGRNVTVPAYNWGDIDGDGDIDSVTARTAYLNTGRGSFVAEIIPTGSDTGNSAIGDVDGDGDLDIFVVHRYAARSFVLLNDGQGRFTRSGQLLESSDSEWVDLADLDGDGDLDAFVGNRFFSSFIYTNDGEGNFSVNGQEFDPYPSNEQFPQAFLHLADMNADGRVDVLTRTADGKLLIWENTDASDTVDLAIDATTTQAFVREGDEQVYSVTVMNLGKQAVDEATVAIRLTNTSENSLLAVDLSPGTGSAAVVGSINGEYLTDTVSLAPGATIVYQLRGTAPDVHSQDSTDWPLVSVSASVSDEHIDFNRHDNTASYVQKVVPRVTDGSVRFLAESLPTRDNRLAGVADLDGDGDLDALLNVVNTALVVWKNDGEARFTPADDSLPVSGIPALGDLDGDGDVDLFLPVRFGYQTWLNDGTGGFSAMPELFEQFAAHAVPRLADFDGDGDLDALGVGDYTYVWLNDGTGRFVAQPGLTMTQSAQYAEIADFDNDGDLDVWSGAILLNDGRGRLTPDEQELPQANTATVGDINGDGFDDLILATLKDGMYVLVNDGAGRFMLSRQYLANLRVDNVSVFDADGDGDLDLWNRFFNGAVYEQIWLNDGEGVFSPSVFLPSSAGNRPAFGDFDGDGDVDIFQQGSSISDGAVLLNANPVDLSVGHTMDGSLATDGDVVTLRTTVANFGSHATRFSALEYLLPDILKEVQLLESTITGTGIVHTPTGPLGESLSLSFDLAPGSSASFLVQAQISVSNIDVRRDQEWLTTTVRALPGYGEFDSNAANSQASESDVLFVLPSQGSFYYRAATTLWNGAATAVAVGDVDLDNDSDVVVATSGHELLLLKNDGSGKWLTPSTLATGINSSALTLADVNGDGKLDIIVADQVADNKVLLNSGAGQFGAPRAVGSVAATTDIVVQDFDGDGRNDIFVINRGVSNELWRSSGNLLWTKVFTDDLDDASVAAVAGDWDNDGDLDLFVVNGDGQVHRVWMNDGAGQFQLASSPDAGVHEAATRVLDLESDGDLDILVVSSDDTHQLLTNDGTGIFTATDSSVLPQIGANRVEVLDADADGYFDLLLQSEQGITLAMNDGTGNFGRHVTFATQHFAGDIAIGDFDRDGDWDLLVAGNILRVFENTPALLADYNFNGIVDAADYTIWKDTFGSSSKLNADGNDDNTVDAADYTVWRDHFGNSFVARATASATSLTDKTWLARTASQLRRRSPVDYESLVDIVMAEQFAGPTSSVVRSNRIVV